MTPLPIDGNSLGRELHHSGVNWCITHTGTNDGANTQDSKEAR